MSIPEIPKVTIHYWANHDMPRLDEIMFMMDAEDLPQDLSMTVIVVPEASAVHAKELLIAGAQKVLLGDAALLDSALVKQLADEFGKERIGVWLPAKRMEVSWSLDLDCNADFRCLTPSLCAPSWEVLKSDGTRTGTEVGWWMEQMFSLGASLALVGAFDLQDDQDLNICAGLTERFGLHFWLTPMGDEVAHLAPAVRFGSVTQLVLSDGFDESTLKACCPASPADEARKFA
jgi:hypothetical protein